MLSEPVQITLGETTYKVEGFTQQVQSAFEQYLANQVLLTIKDGRGMLGETDYFAAAKRSFIPSEKQRLLFRGRVVH